MEESSLIKFRVRYRLGEYLHIVRARALTNADFVGCTPSQQRLLLPIITLACAVLFLRKSWIVGECHFEIDRSGVTRRSKGGRVVCLPWAEVSGVKEFAVGYLIEKGDGGMPVPFRVLSPRQRSALAALFQLHVAQPN
jgi:hypothetical protein